MTGSFITGLTIGYITGLAISLVLMYVTRRPKGRGRIFRMYGVTRPGEKPNVLGLRIDQVGEPKYINREHPNGYSFRVYDVIESRSQPYGE